MINLNLKFITYGRWVWFSFQVYKPQSHWYTVLVWMCVLMSCRWAAIIGWFDWFLKQILVSDWFPRGSLWEYQGPGHVHIENGEHGFTTVSELTDMFPQNGVQQALRYIFSLFVGVSATQRMAFSAASILFGCHSYDACITTTGCWTHHCLRSNKHFTSFYGGWTCPWTHQKNSFLLLFSYGRSFKKWLLFLFILFGF